MVDLLLEPVLLWLMLVNQQDKLTQLLVNPLLRPELKKDINLLVVYIPFFSLLPLLPLPLQYIKKTLDLKTLEHHIPHI